MDAIKIISPEIIIPACDGRLTLANSSHLFYRINIGDADLALDQLSNITLETSVMMWESHANQNFQMAFGAEPRNNKNILTLAQIILFAADKGNKKYLNRRGYMTFLPFGYDSQYYVAGISLPSKNHLEIYKDKIGVIFYEYNNAYKWSAENRYRFVLRI